MEEDEAAAEVAAMQFAGGISIARVAELWERDVEWVEGAIRRALLESIPRRDGGTKLSRTEARAMRHCMEQPVESVQGQLEFKEVA
jgi:hypothetical protein